MIQECQTRKDFERLVASSHQRPAFLLKHSTRCPISAAAWRVFQHYDTDSPDVALWRVLVVENGQLSREIANKVGVRHQSPQVLLFSKGMVVWHDSHWSITEEALDDALTQVAAG